MATVTLFVGTGKVILESAILTTVVVLSLTFYTFWAAKKGYDFNFLGPFLFGAIIVLMVFALIQVNNNTSHSSYTCSVLVKNYIEYISFIFGYVFAQCCVDIFPVGTDLSDDLRLLGIYNILRLHSV